jgi:hypothetical protein
VIEAKIRDASESGACRLPGDPWEDGGEEGEEGEEEGEEGALPGAGLEEEPSELLVGLSCLSVLGFSRKRLEQ